MGRKLTPKLAVGNQASGLFGLCQEGGETF